MLISLVLETANPGLYASLVRQREAGAFEMHYANLAGGAIERRRIVVQPFRD
ncbi:MAG: hypothetical protein ABIM50_04390 [Novosphingobium sp.]